MSRYTMFYILLLVVLTSCGENPGEKPAETRTGTTDNNRSRNSAETGDRAPHGSPDGITASPDSASADRVMIASDIVTDVIIRPDPEGDPWEIEKVSGYSGNLMVNTIFERIYDGNITAYDYHSGKPMKPGEVRKIEKEFSNDRAKIGKLSFTEDWFYDPSENSIEKIAKSVVFGYELYNGEGKVYAYRAAFRAQLGNNVSSSPGDNP